MTVQFPTPPPSGFDPHGFAVGALTTRQLEREGLRLSQWRWYYGPEIRIMPFEDHVALDGRFMNLDGTLRGFWPGDHKGCRCGVLPVYVDDRRSPSARGRLTDDG